MEPNEAVSLWRRIIVGAHKSWVLFEHDTCVILMEPENDLVAQATALLREWGPVQAGSSSGDFGTIDLEAEKGWVVTCHHNDILTYVGPEEVDPTGANDLVVGLLGRSKRDQDAQELRVLHVEDNRAIPGQ